VSIPSLANPSAAGAFFTIHEDSTMVTFEPGRLISATSKANEIFAVLEFGLSGTAAACSRDPISRTIVVIAMTQRSLSRFPTYTFDN